MIDIVDRLAAMPIAEWNEARLEILKLREQLDNRGVITEYITTPNVDTNQEDIITKLQDTLASETTSRLEAERNLSEYIASSKNTLEETVSIAQDTTEINDLKVQLASKVAAMAALQSGYNTIEGMLHNAKAKVTALVNENAKLLEDLSNAEDKLNVVKVPPADTKSVVLKIANLFKTNSKE